MDSLTAIAGYPNVLPFRKNARSKSDAKPGMAYFAGTGPFGKSCGDCSFKGYFRNSENGSAYWVAACSKFKELAGKHGPDIRNEYPACKYFSHKKRK